MPAGYEEMTVAAIKEQSTGWNAPEARGGARLRAGARQARKGALAALESALADEGEQS